MKKVIIFIVLIFTLIACSDYDLDDIYKSTNKQISNFDEIKEVTNKVKATLLNVGIDDFKKELSKNDSQIIDLRTIKELENSGIIEGAKQIDFYSRNFKEQLKKLDKNKKYLIYCRSGGRSSQTMGIMSELGFKNVIELRGGMNNWLKSGEKTVDFIKNKMNDDNIINNNIIMNEKIITLNAKKWEFDKKVLTFKKGEKVKIKVNNIDGLHGIAIPDMRLMDDNEIEVDTSKIGEFEFRCLNYCGEGHQDMTGKIIIE